MSQNVPQCLTPTDANAAPNPISEPPDAISDRQRVALEMIAGGSSDTATASAIGVHRRTIYRWRVEDARFREELERRRRELYERVQDRFRTMLGAALDVLDKQIKDAYVPTARSAARTLLALAAIGKAAAPAGE